MAHPKSAREQTTKPNIVFILVDNVGWGDSSVYGGTTAKPRIDALADEGSLVGL
jgi:arylsulfatase